MALRAEKPAAFKGRLFFARGLPLGGKDID